MVDTIDIIEKAAPKSIQDPPAFLTRTVFRFSDPTGFSADQWRLIAAEPINSMAIEFIVRELCALSFVISAKDRDDKRPEKYTEDWENIFRYDGGFDNWMARMIEDACVLPFGAIAEVGRNGEELDWALHIDAGTVLPTYQKTLPYVQVNPDDWQQRVFFKEKQVSRLRVYPRSDIRFKEYQKAPTERAFLPIEALSKIYIYYIQQLTDTPPPGILDVMDMTAAKAKVWAASFRELLMGIDPIKVPLLTDHTIPAKFIPFGRSPNELNITEQYKRFAEMLLGKYGLSIGDLRLFEHESTKAGERVSQLVTERSGIGFWAAKFEAFLTHLLPTGLKFEFKQPRPERELVVAQRKKTQLESLLAASGNKQLISVKDAVEEAAALELFLTEVEPVEEKEEEPPPQMLPGQSPMPQQGEGPKPQEVQDQEEDEDLAKAVLKQVKEELGEWLPPRAPIVERFTELWKQIFAHIGERLPVTEFAPELEKAAARVNSLGISTEAKADVEKQTAVDEVIESILDNNTWWEVPTLFEDDLLEILDELTVDGLNYAAGDIQKALTGDAVMAIAWDLNDPEVYAWIDQHGAEMVQNVDAGTKFYLREMIKELIDEGFPGAATSVQRLRYDIFGLDPAEASKFTDARIRSIVNYEVNKAMSRAGHNLRDKVGLQLKQWFVNQVNPCDICLENAAKGVVKSDFMYEGVFGPILYPPAHPQTCRCLTTADENEVRSLGHIDWPWTITKSLAEKGGAGSGNWGHAGRPGIRGGSASPKGGAPLGATKPSGYQVSRNEALKKFGLHGPQLNNLIKAGMPSEKVGGKRYLKFPEAEVWFNAYNKAGKGKAGIKAANDAIFNKVKYEVANPPKRPVIDKPAPPPTKDTGGKTVNVNEIGDGKLPRNVLKAGPKHALSTKQGQSVEMNLSVLPQHHLNTIKEINSMTAKQMRSRWGSQAEGWIGAHVGCKGGGEITLREGYHPDRGVAVHEVGHSVHWALSQGRARLGKNGPFEGGTGYENSTRRKAQLDAFGTATQRRKLMNRNEALFEEAKTKLGGRSGFNLAAHTGSGFVTTYSATNSKEFFAESYQHYVHKPRFLNIVNPGMYQLMSDVFGGTRYVGTGE